MPESRLDELQDERDDEGVDRECFRERNREDHRRLDLARGFRIPAHSLNGLSADEPDGNRREHNPEGNGASDREQFDAFWIHRSDAQRMSEERDIAPQPTRISDSTTVWRTGSSIADRSQIDKRSAKVGPWLAESLVPLVVRDRCDLEEDKCKDGKDERLDKADEELKAKEWEWRAVRDQRCNDDQEHLPGEDVPEEPEGEGNDLGKLAHELEEPDEERDGVPHIEELAEVTDDPKLPEAPEVCCENRNECQREGGVEVRIPTAEERDKHFASAMDGLDANRPNTRKESKPVERNNKEEERRDERKDALGGPAAAGDAVHQGEEKFNDELNGRLDLPRNHMQPSADEERREDKARRDDPAHEERVRHGEWAEMSDSFGGEGDLRHEDDP